MRSIVLTALCIVLSTPAAFADQAYKTPDYQFKYPSKCQAPAGHSPSPLLKCSGFTISVSQMPFKSPVALEDFAKRNISTVSAAYKLIDEGRTNMGNKLVAYAVTLTGATNSTMTKKYAFVTPEAGYVVTYIAPAKEFKKHQHAAETVMKSFKSL